VPRQWQQSPSTPAFSTSHAALRAHSLLSRRRLKSVMYWYGYLTFYVSDFVRPFCLCRLFCRLPLAAASDRAMTKAPCLVLRPVQNRTTIETIRASFFCFHYFHFLIEYRFFLSNLCTVHFTCHFHARQAFKPRIDYFYSSTISAPHLILDQHS
jgi:hypothetical protein